MAKLLKICFFLILGINVFFASWFVLHNDIAFPSDIARDFLLLNEIAEKKVVLIGPRSSTGLFHGPLWLYLNYPAYVVGNGNPIVVGWFWIFLTILFTASCYFVGKNLFDKKTGIFFALMASTYSSFHSKGLFNPHGAMFLIPIFFYFFIRYIQTFKLKYLLTHVVILGLIIQFQMAIGIPFTILSFTYVFWNCLREKKLKPLLSYFLLALIIGNFIMFDLRHDFMLLRKVLGFISPTENGYFYNYIPLIADRIRLMLTSPEIIRRDPGYVNFALFLITLVFVFFQIKDNRHKIIYQSFLYFYFGFFLLSFINKGFILYFYLFPIFPFVFLIFSSFSSSRFKKAFIPLFFIVLFLNIWTEALDAKDAQNLIGKDLYSWKALNNMAKRVFEGKEKEFGYFVYSPDVLAYEPKYAMFYQQKQTGKSAFSFQKKPITYLFIAPPPANNPFMKDDWWVRNQVKMGSSFSAEIKFNNGYKIQKYKLSDEEIKIPFDPSIDPGIHFR